MSKYTTELRFLCETLAGLDESSGYASVRDFVIPTARPHIFDFNYPIFDTNYKPELESKIIRHFYTREICEETFGLWKLRLDDKMNMIMPYYNQLYESALIKFNPLIDAEYSVNHIGKKSEAETGMGHNSRTEEFDKSKNKNINYTDSETSQENNVGVSDGKYNDASEKYNLHSDTPEGGIDGIEILESEHSVFLSDATKNTDNSFGGNENSAMDISTGRSDKTKTGDEIDIESGKNNGAREYVNNSQSIGENSYIDIITGKRNHNSMSKLLKEFRETFLNIDKMVIDELESLFFMLW